MKKINRKQMVAAAIMIFCAATAAGIGAVYAADSDSKSNPMSGLVAAIASKFNLNQAEVQAVFDEQKTQMEANRQAKMAEMETKRQADFVARLGELVTSGKLTQAQVDAIKAKSVELKAARATEKIDMESMKDKTEAERQAVMEARKTKMEAERIALKQWAADNGIPEEYIPMAGRMGGGHGRGGGFGGARFGDPAPVAN